MSNWCEKHDHFKRDCPWCEIEELEADIEQLKQSQQWISVEDRLPKVAGDYLVYSIAGREVGKWTKEGWKVWTTDAFEGLGWCHPDYPVTHWMPLPEPPKGAHTNE